MQLQRLPRHLFASHWRTRRQFTPQIQAQIEAAITAAEATHDGQIRFAIETALHLSQLLRGLTPRQRALQVFAQLHVWDTQANNGVLIYVSMADRAVEIIADRGIAARVASAQWDGVCREVEKYYRASQFADGSLAAITGVAHLLRQQFPAGDGPENELPNQPVLL